MRRDTGQQGVALITALLVVAMVTVITVALANRHSLDLRRATLQFHHDQAWLAALGAEAWARGVLRQDFQDNRQDTLGDRWNRPLPPEALPGGTVRARIEDLQARFNLNALLPGEAADEVAMARFQRLASRLGMDGEQLIPPLLDWLDPDQTPRDKEGRELGHYLGLELPYRTADRAMASPSELLLVEGVTWKMMQQLRPHVATLPAATGINLNTAPAPVLMSLANGLLAEEVEELVKNRPPEGFKDVATALQQPGLAGHGIDPGGLTLASDYFLVHAEVTMGDSRLKLASLLQRKGDKGVVTVLKREVESW